MSNEPSFPVAAKYGVLTTQNDGAYGGVDIAEDAHHAGAGKANGPIGSGRIQADVEDLAAVAGKGVVENGIGVREIDGGSRGDGQHMRREGFIFLQHGGASIGLGRVAGIDRDGVDDDARIVLLPGHGFGVGIAGAQPCRRAWRREGMQQPGAGRPG